MNSTSESLAQAGADLRELVGGRTELPVLTGPDGFISTENDLIEFALGEFSRLP